jgi:hypothetical protein
MYEIKLSIQFWLCEPGDKANLNMVKDTNSKRDVAVPLVHAKAGIGARKILCHLRVKFIQLHGKTSEAIVPFKVFWHGT